MVTAMSVTSLDFKQALGRFASGVTVISVETEGVPVGMTASAFLSVSLDPPLVLVSVAKKAQMHARLVAGAAWTASVLSADQEKLSNLFAGYGQGEPEWIDDTGGAPRLAGSLAWVACTPFAAHDAGDHTLFVGKVESSGIAEGAPLLYFTGKYRFLAPLPD